MKFTTAATLRTPSKVVSIRIVLKGLQQIHFNACNAWYEALGLGGITKTLRFDHGLHISLPCIKFSAPPANAPVLSADMHAINAILVAFTLAHSPVLAETPVRFGHEVRVSDNEERHDDDTRRVLDGSVC